ncbi:class II aldolase/adducin family protein [Gordonia sp. PKS22-38]|uniref:Class II aldolase/adducin family protein n=1 Tax=Gordonia prachuapensis TaxID=3115651 RepID=A0ABU7MUR9_9ACTN|nr:class II aldolase/adducin family protein [Gordonia sp. PKS22-38]
MTESPADDLGAVRELIATGCRVLAARNLAPGILGHISVRLDESRLAIRCRGPQERGLAFTTAHDVRVVTFDGEAGDPGELDGGYTPPHELPLHAETLRRRADISCVVHAHPPSVVAADLADIEIRPIVGAYDIPGSALARDGVPVYPRSVLIRRTDLAAEMVAHLGDKSVVLLRGHGMTAVGRSVEEAVLRAISINSIAALSLDIRQAGGVLTDIADTDVAELPDLGGSLNTSTAWRHEVASLPA